MEIQTNRLLLRPWKEEDFTTFAAINSDHEVMEFFPSLLTKEESDSFAIRIMKYLEDNGYGMWAVEVAGVASFIGYIGIKHVDFNTAFTPAIEIGWRLAKEFWGNGYATEGAKAVLHHGFEKLKLEKIVSFTTKENFRSRKVMEKIGLRYHPELDFDHPKVVEGPLKRHVLYQMTQEEWKSWNE